MATVAARRQSKSIVKERPETGASLLRRLGESPVPPIIPPFAPAAVDRPRSAVPRPGVVHHPNKKHWIPGAGSLWYVRNAERAPLHPPAVTPYGAQRESCDLFLGGGGPV